MSQKYQATGIVLKGSSIKENDRLVTVLTPEYGLIRAVAPGAKKHKSRLRGRTELFVVNQLLLVRGRSLDKIIQADTVYTYPGLSRDLGKLATAQYLAEVALALAVDKQPQLELYELLNEHLRRLESLNDGASVYPNLAQAVFHLIAIAGLTPQVFECCLTQKVISPQTALGKVGFSFEGGGIVDLRSLQPQQPQSSDLDDEEIRNIRLPKVEHRLNSLELVILQQLGNQDLPDLELLKTEGINSSTLNVAWIRIEKVLREYIQYHLGKTILSANLVDNLYIEF
ncbi:MAG: DNA repair protein RecO [Cyanobacteria bacterium J06621_8]